MEYQVTKEILDKVFFNDGSLRDIYVLDVGIDDWQRFIDWVCNSSRGTIFYKDGEKQIYNKTNVAKLFKEKEHHNILLSIDFKGVFINCHFFEENKMELDINPKEISSQNEVNAVFEFMRKLSNVLDKEI